MDIRLQCRPNISVTQKLTEALDVHTILHAPCRVGMSEGVKIPIADTAAFQQLPVSVLQCARFHRRVRVGQQIIVSLNALGGRFQQFQHIIGNGYKTHRTAAFRGLHHQMCPGSIAYTGSRALNSQKAGAVVNVAFAQSADLTMKRFVKCFFELLTQIIVKVRKCKVQRVCVLHFQLAGSGGCFFLMKLYH